MKEKEIREERKRLEELLEKVTEEGNVLLQRIVGVSCDELREQLRGDYLSVEERAKQTRDAILDLNIEEWTMDQKRFWTRGHSPTTDFLRALTATNGWDPDSLTEQCRVRRVRIPETIRDKRKVMQFCRDIGLKIILRDLRGRALDSLGNGPRVLRLNIYARVDALPRDFYDAVKIQEPVVYGV